MIAPELMDPFHRALREKLLGVISDRTEALASGGAAQGAPDTPTVAEKYAALVSYIAALRGDLDLCDELDRERYGQSKED